MSTPSIQARQILDSRGSPTIEVTLHSHHGVMTAAVPSGASKGDYEAHELRDRDSNLFNGAGVSKAVHNINTIIGPKLLASGIQWAHQAECDEFLIQLDGSDDKSRLGANALLAVSMVFARTGAAASEVPLYRHIARLSGMKDGPFVMPVPCFNVLNGGVHAGNELPFQEFMIIPSGAETFEEAYRVGAETYHKLKEVIKERFGVAGTNVGDEGGFAPPIATADDAFDLLTDAVTRAGHKDVVQFGLDPASSEFLRGASYDLTFKSDKSKLLTASELSEYYQQLIDKYPLVLLEDPFGQDDWQAWSQFPKSIEVVGDDLLATNPKRIATAVGKKACNSALIKINQIGTITEAIQAVKDTYAAGWSAFVSHRSGETTDDFIADLVVGVRSGHIKSGAPCRGERVAKYNRLLQIETELQGKSKYAGKNFRRASGM